MTQNDDSSRIEQDDSNPKNVYDSTTLNTEIEILPADNTKVPRKRSDDSIGKQRKAASGRDKLRFFYPSEFYKFLSMIDDSKLRFCCEFLINTGMRYDEASHVKVSNIDLERRNITVIKGKKGRQRKVFISSQFCFKLKQHILQNKLGEEDYLGFITLQGFDKIIKRIAGKAEIKDFANITSHTFRKTLENYLIALDVNTMTISMQLGHTVDVAIAYYAAQFFKTEERPLIRGILGDLFQKNE